MPKSIILLSLTFTNFGITQWEQVSNGMFGGSVSSMCFSDSGFFIGTYREGMFKLQVRTIAVFGDIR